MISIHFLLLVLVKNMKAPELNSLPNFILIRKVYDLILSIYWDFRVKVSFSCIAWPSFQVKKVVSLLNCTAYGSTTTKEREPKWKVIYHHLVVGCCIDFIPRATKIPAVTNLFGIISKLQELQQSQISAKQLELLSDPRHLLTLCLSPTLCCRIFRNHSFLSFCPLT